MNKAPVRSWAAHHESTGFLAQGSSTSSKVPAIEGAEPAQICRGNGCRVWDADGNEYIDFRNALGPVTLGYAVPEINAAIAEQLERGIVYGHPHPLEGEVAKLLVEAIPCAERVRFLKTGGEAIAACIKIARHATQRNTILQCGYNGWLNSLSGTLSTGVPPAVAALHQALPWGDIEPWEEAFAGNGDIAAAVVASNYSDMEKGAAFLPALRKLTEEHGALLVMDEIVTGFRLAVGGAQEYFGFMPDMAVFGKGMANGMPISVYAGKAVLIDSARELGISSTFGGETLSLASCKAVVGFYRKNNVIDHLWTTGKRLWGEMNRLFGENGLAISLDGLSVCPVFEGDAALINDFFRASYRHGVSFYNVPYVNYSHKEQDVVETLGRVAEAILTLETENG